MQIRFAIPGDLDARTGGYGYDRSIIAGLEAVGFAVDVIGLAGDFPSASPASVAAAEAALAGIPAGEVTLVDGLAFGALPGVAERHGRRLALVALVHHPLCLETGLTPEAARALEEAERAALGHARHVVVTGNETAREVARRFDVPHQRISVVLPGTGSVSGPGSAARASMQPDGRLRILSVGTLSPRKGHDTLISALARIAGLEWDARIVGNATMHPETAAALKAQARDLGLADRVDFAGEVESAVPEMLAAQIFALASRYEGYGMAFAEAMAHGLPVVGCRAGAVPDVVPPEAGYLVPPDDPAALAGALRRLIEDGPLRHIVAEGAWQAGRRLPTWQDAARAFADILAAAPRLTRIAEA
jgi:glycosyltransferase involved in cell wall biosynthesis